MSPKKFIGIIISEVPNLLFKRNNPINDCSNTLILYFLYVDSLYLWGENTDKTTIESSTRLPLSLKSSIDGSCRPCFILSWLLLFLLNWAICIGLIILVLFLNKTESLDIASISSFLVLPLEALTKVIWSIITPKICCGLLGVYVLPSNVPNFFKKDSTSPR